MRKNIINLFLLLLVCILITSCMDLVPDSSDAVSPSGNETGYSVDTREITTEDGKFLRTAITAKGKESNFAVSNDYLSNMEYQSLLFTPLEKKPVTTKYSGGAVVHLSNSEDFAREVSNYNGYVLVDFYKGGCTNCVYSGWAMEQLAKQNYAGVKYCNVQTFGSDVDVTNARNIQWFKEYYKLENDFAFNDWFNSWLTNDCSNRSERACRQELNAALAVLEAENVNIEGSEQYPYIILFKDGKPIGAIQGGQPYYDRVDDKNNVDKTVQCYMGGWDKIGLRTFINSCVEVSEPEQPSTGSWTKITQDTSKLVNAFKTNHIREIPSSIYVPDWFFGKFETTAYMGANVINSGSFFAMPTYISTGYIQYQYVYQALLAKGNFEFTEEDFFNYIDGNVFYTIEDPTDSSRSIKAPNPYCGYFNYNDSVYLQASAEEKKAMIEARVAELERMDNYFNKDNHGEADPFDPIIQYGTEYMNTVAWGEEIVCPTAPSRLYSYYILDASDNYVSVYVVKHFPDNDDYYTGSVFEVRKGGRFTMDGDQITGYEETNGDDFIEYGEFGFGGLMDWEYMWPYCFLDEVYWTYSQSANANKTMSQAEVEALMSSN